jgi:hypothetical protein
VHPATPGVVRIFLGHAPGATEGAPTLRDDPQSGAFSGATVLSLGDLNGDGRAEFAVGRAELGAGRAFIYGGFQDRFDPTPVVVIEGRSPDRLFGMSMRALRAAAGASLVAIGVEGASGDRRSDGYSVDARSGTFLVQPTSAPAPAFGSVGVVVATGDISGDGIDDVVVDHHDAFGIVFEIAFGLSTAFVPALSVPVDTAANGTAIVGDLSGDQIGDLVLTYTRDGTLGEGTIAVYSGAPDRPVLARSINGPDGPGGWFGVSVAR